MRAFVKRWRWWLLAVLLALIGAELFLAQDPDGSQAALEEVQVGMSRGQVDGILVRTSYTARRGPIRLVFPMSGPPGPTPVIHVVNYSYREHDLSIYFDEKQTVILKDRWKNGQKAPWWEPVLSFLNRIRAALGV